MTAGRVGHKTGAGPAARNEAWNKKPGPVVNIFEGQRIYRPAPDDLVRWRSVHYDAENESSDTAGVTAGYPGNSRVQQRRDPNVCDGACLGCLRHRGKGGAGGGDKGGSCGKDGGRVPRRLRDAGPGGLGGEGVGRVRRGGCCARLPGKNNRSDGRDAGGGGRRSREPRSDCSTGR